MSREDIILTVANHRLEEEKANIKKDIIYFENKKKSLKDSGLTNDELALKEYETDDTLTLALASRLTSIYNSSEGTDYYNVAKTGLSRGKFVYEEELNYRNRPKQELKDWYQDILSEFSEEEQERLLAEPEIAEIINFEPQEEDLDLLSQCIIEGINSSLSETISDYINETNEFSPVIVRDAEIIRKYKDAKTYLNSTRIEMSDFDLVRLLSNPNVEEVLDNYRLLQKLSIINPKPEANKIITKK